MRVKVSKMALPLYKSQAINEIAGFLYNFLPGNPHPYADQSISFRGIANDMGLIMFWQNGSKRPAITTLLGNTLEYRSDLFCNLILNIVRRGLAYRNNKGEPITREEIQELNELIKKVEFKIPELWNTEFLNSLPSDELEHEDKNQDTQQILADLNKTLVNLSKIEGQKRGFAFEKFLNDLFDAFGLEPRSSFRLVGEQIDGSLQLDGNTYLIEAKWWNKQVGEAELLALRGKVEGKATWSRGLFISYNGFTKDGLEAFSRGKATNIICMDSQDIYFILEGKMSLSEAIELKARRAAETGNIFVQVYELERTK